MGKPRQSLEMSSIGTAGATASAAGGGYRDKVDDAEKDDFDSDDMESDETEISPPLNIDIGRNGMKTKRLKLVAMACIVLAGCLALVVGLFHRKGDSDSGNGGGLLSNTQLYGDKQDNQGIVPVAEDNDNGGPSENGNSKIIEFTVANLNTNANTSTNKFRILLHPEWAPIGVERFEVLTSSNFWQEVRIFRVVPNFVVQFGINSDPDVQKSWSSLGPIPDDPVVASNVRGTVTFATSGPNSRTTQIFINTNDNAFLDEQGFAPIGEVLPKGEGYGGMSVVDEFYFEYYENPDQWKIEQEGETYLNEMFPLLSFFVDAQFVEEQDGNN
ncbi:hypothetical protein ACHAXH_004181 [Discostella pseudostelligera]